MNDTLCATDTTRSPNPHRDFPRAARHGGIILAALVLAALLLALASPISAQTVRSPFLVENIKPGKIGSVPDGAVNFKGALFFSAADGKHGPELWRSDGTAKGTKLVEDIFPGRGSVSEVEDLANVKNTLFFAADNGNYGNEFWKSDGTVKGTKLVKDILPGPGSGSPDEFAGLKGVLLFRAIDKNNGEEVWKSAGTEKGTKLVKDIH